MLSLFFASILSSAAPSLAAVTITPVNGPVVQDSYIVKLKSSANRDTHLSRISSSFARSQSFVDIAYDSNFLKAYAGVFRGESLEQLLEDEANEIEYVVPNGIVDINEAIVQTDAPWGLQAVSQRTPTGRSDTGSLNYTYPYDSTAQGEGVDIYIVDTGVFIEHSDFGGRATFGFAAGSYAKADGHGHGTHCAGTAAGTKYGVAKKASVIGVKVLSDAGSGSVADIAAGLQYVVNNVAATGKPSVASMSLGGSANVALDDAVKSTIAAGIPVTVAAGNSNANSQTFSPARVPEAITVGASTIANARSSFSNYGAAVDVFAPGSLVISAWRGGVNATNNISGTSMATPHVAGVVAALFSKEGVKSPAAIEARIIELSTPGVITGIPVTNPVTPNRFVYLGDIASEPEPTETSSTVTPTVTSSSSTPTPTEPSTTPTPTSTPTPTPTPIVVTVTVTPTLTLTLTV